MKRPNYLALHFVEDPKWQCQKKINKKIFQTSFYKYSEMTVVNWIDVVRIMLTVAWECVCVRDMEANKNVNDDMLIWEELASSGDGGQMQQEREKAEESSKLFWAEERERESIVYLIVP